MVSLVKRLPETSPYRVAHPICVMSRVYKYYNKNPPPVDQIPLSVIEEAAKWCYEHGKVHGVAEMAKKFKGSLMTKSIVR